jgi:hydrogenase expression/formation protein HypC
MCLAVPAKIISIKKTIACCRVSGVSRDVDIRLVPDVRAGDYVLVHAGFAIERLNAAEAKKTMKLLKEAGQ